MSFLINKMPPSGKRGLKYLNSSRYPHLLLKQNWVCLLKIFLFPEPPFLVYDTFSKSYLIPKLRKRWDARFKISINGNNLGVNGE